MFVIPFRADRPRPRRQGWDRLLMAGFAAATVGGLLFVVAPDFVGLGWLNRGVVAAFFGPADEPPGAVALRHWLYAVEGSTLVAFGILGLGVAATAFRCRERWARNALALAVGVWYPLDTLVSLAHGVMVNAALNTGIAVVLLVPLLATWRQFGEAGREAMGAPLSRRAPGAGPWRPDRAGGGFRRPAHSPRRPPRGPAGRPSTRA